VKRAAGEAAALDYAVVTHFHPDHIAGLSKVAAGVAIRKLIDRGYPEYGDPAKPSGAVFESYRKFAEALAKEQGAVRERIRPGRADQIVPVHERGAYPAFEVRSVAANGDVWTGSGDETKNVFPPGAGLPEEDRAPENPCSIALRIRYGRFTYYTGGDLYGQPEPGAPSWWDVETPIAKAIGATDVMVVNHHGSIEPANPFFLSTLRPRVVIVPAWSATHPSPDVLKRLLSKRIWPAPRDVFVTRLREPTKLTIGARAQQVASDAGHVVVRVEPGGASYRVFVVDDTSESGIVKSVHGPYTPQVS
jgi:beta-lactamase superfamily II metal-dependent hydrolase